MTCDTHEPTNDSVYHSGAGGCCGASSHQGGNGCPQHAWGEYSRMNGRAGVFAVEKTPPESEKQSQFLLFTFTFQTAASIPF